MGSEEWACWRSNRLPSLDHIFPTDVKLGIFSGQFFWFDGEVYSTDEAFVAFVTSFCPYFDKIVFYDRVRSERKLEVYTLDPLTTDVCPLPDFDLYSVGRNLFIVFPKILRILKEHIRRCDLVWLPGPHPVSLLFAYLCHKTNTPFFQMVRANLIEQVKHTNHGIKRHVAVATVFVLEHIARRLARNHLTFTVGREMFHLYSKKGRDVHETRISLIEDKDIDHTLELQDCGLHDPIRLLSVGRLDAEKGLIHLIEAVEQMISKTGTDVQLQVVGKGYKGDEEQRLRAVVENHALTEHIRFLGYIPFGPRLLSLYRENDIFVLPSLSGEGVPQTIFEAMACGIPIVATRVAGIPDAIQHGRNGMLIPAGSPEHIVSALRTLVDDKTLRQSVIQNGFETARLHTQAAERQRILDQIADLLEESPS